MKTKSHGTPYKKSTIVDYLLVLPVVTSIIQRSLIFGGTMAGDGTMTVADIGQAIRLARRRAGLTQVDAAGLCGVSPPFLNAVENGKESAHLGKVLHVCRQLGISFSLHQPNEDQP